MRILKVMLSAKMLRSTTVLNIDDNNKCFLNNKSTFSFAIEGINHTLKCIIIKQLNNISQYFCFYYIFLLNQCSLGEHKRLIKKKVLNVQWTFRQIFLNVIICLEMHCDSCQRVDTMCSGQRCVCVVCPFMLLYVCMHVFVHIIALLVCPYSHFHQLYLLLKSLHTFQALGSYHVTMHFPKLSYLPLWFATSNAC